MKYNNCINIIIVLLTDFYGCHLFDYFLYYVLGHSSFYWGL